MYSSNVQVDQTDRRMVIHNIGSGVQLQDVLFEFEIIEHFRYF